jgi:predicted ATPase
VLWKAIGVVLQGYLLAATGNARDGVQKITSGIAAIQSTGATMFLPLYLSYLTRAHASLGRFEDARRFIEQATKMIETSGERSCEADVLRTAGEITLISPAGDTATAEAYFERSLAVARAQQAKSWELRAAMSMARLWRDQGKRDEARDLLAPVYGWFTEGFDTLDLKQAKTLLDELAQ